MPVLVSTLGSLASKLLMSLVTEAFIKRVVIAILEAIVKRTETDLDDKVLKAAKEAWEAASEPTTPDA